MLHLFGSSIERSDRSPLMKKIFDIEVFADDDIASGISACASVFEGINYLGGILGVQGRHHMSVDCIGCTC